MNPTDDTPLYTIAESYPSGHEMSYEHYGPATEQQFRFDNVPENKEDGGWSVVLAQLATLDGTDRSLEQKLDELFSEGMLYETEAYTYELIPVKNWCVQISDGRERHLYGPFTPKEAEINFQLAVRYTGYNDAEVEAIKLESEIPEGMQ